MLVFLLILLGILLLCLAVISIGASLDEDFRKIIEGGVRNVFSSQAPLQVSSNYKPTLYEPELVTEDHMDSENEAPATWDPQVITAGLRRLHDNPPLLEYFIDSIKERLILGQDYRTSNSRIRYLQNQIKELNIAKDYLTALDDLNFHEIEKEIRHRELELKKEDLENKRKAQQDLEDLRLQRDKLKIKVEMAHLTREIDQIENPPTTRSNPPDGDTKRKEH